MKKIFCILCLLALCITQTACSRRDEKIPENEASPVRMDSVSYSRKDLETGYTDPTRLEVTGDVTITEGGTYLLTGTAQGQILVDAHDEDVRLVLAGLQLQNTGTAALYIREAGNVYVTLDAGTENALSSYGAFVQSDNNNIDAALFCKSDLTINGEGSLTVVCETGHGIVSKDDLKITGGIYDITAAGQCIVGKDSTAVADGIFTLTGGKDGIHSEHEDAEEGNVYLDGGTFTIRTDGDGISASGTLYITGGTYDILAGGSTNGTQTGGEEWMGGGMQIPGGFGGRENRGEMPGGMGMPEGMNPGEMPDGMELPEGMTPGEIPGGMQDSTSQTEQGTASAVDSSKGLKAGSHMAITGGAFTIDAADDAIHTNADLTISGGVFAVCSGDDGIHGDGNVEITDGTVEIVTSYEGIEGHTIHLAGGTVTLNASDDGLNAAGGNDGSGFGGFFGGMDAFASDESAGVTISGGSLVVKAAGDGIDSNGYLRVSGGTTFINGPTNSANGALDYATEGTITGGTFIALGAAGMAMNFDTSSSQGAAMCSVNGTAGGSITLTDETGTELLSYNPLSAYTSLVISVPGMAAGQSYTLTVDGSSQSLEMTDTIVGTGGMMGGFGGFGGMGGSRGEKGGRGGW